VGQISIGDLGQDYSGGYTISVTTAPGAKLSATIARFCSALHPDPPPLRKAAFTGRVPSLPVLWRPHDHHR
jgi:hypothetical protein